MKALLIFISAFSIQALADLPVVKERVTLARFSEGQNIEVVGSRSHLLGHVIEIKVDGNSMYKIEIPGSNSWTKDLLNNLKRNLHRELSDLAALNCSSEEYVISSELTSVEADLFSDRLVTVVDPETVKVQCVP